MYAILEMRKSTNQAAINVDYFFVLMTERRMLTVQ